MHFLSVSDPLSSVQFVCEDQVSADKERFAILKSNDLLQFEELCMEFDECPFGCTPECK